MFDIDGQVIDARTMVSKVEHLAKMIDERWADVDTPITRQVHEPEAGDEVKSRMLAIQTALFPPLLVAPAGFRARLGWLVKRLVRKLTSWYVDPRWDLQREFDGRTIELSTHISLQISRLAFDLDTLRRENTRLKLQVVTAVERLNRFRRDIRTLVNPLEVDRYSQSVMSRLNEVVSSDPNRTHIDYVAFEDRCRGSSDAIRQAQQRYVQLFPPPDPSGRILDIGCGRGEMVELLIKAGHSVVGIDPDSRMVSLCQAKGLPVVEDDALNFLGRLADDSLRGIFCAQVVEHMITPDLERFLQLSRKKLVKNGVLIVETINPRSAFALGNHFFADATHTRPVHPETLRFFCEQVGFTRVQMEERSPHPALELAKGLPKDNSGQALDLLLTNVFGYQDYVIVATK